MDWSDQQLNLQPKSLRYLDRKVVFDCNLLQSCLDKTLNSPIFANAPKQQKLLNYLVCESLAGNGKKLKGYIIAIEALGSKAEFDPTSDSLVRVNAKRLRESLCKYYLDFGKEDEIHFHLAVGGYEIIFLHKLIDSQKHYARDELLNSDRRQGCDRRRSANRELYKKKL
jgi:hypothetical protein